MELQKQNRTIIDLLSANRQAIESVLPKHLTPERMMRIAYVAISKNPKLGQCKPISLANAIIEASMMGLEIGGPLAYAHLLPFKGEATLIIGYQGYIDLAHRSGKIETFMFQPVYENDEFSYCYGLNPDLIHIPAETNRGELKYAYAVVKYINGGFDFEVVTKSIAMKAKAKSPAKNSKSSPWNQKDLEYTMWCKTAVRKLSKRLPKSPEDRGNLQRAAVIEERVEAGLDSLLDHVPLPDTNGIDKKPKRSLGSTSEPEPPPAEQTQNTPEPQMVQVEFGPVNIWIPTELQDSQAMIKLYGESAEHSKEEDFDGIDGQKYRNKEELRELWKKLKGMRA